MHFIYVVFHFRQEDIKEEPEEEVMEVEEDTDGEPGETEKGGAETLTVDKEGSESASGGANDSSRTDQGVPSLLTPLKHLEEEQIHFLNKILLLLNCKRGALDFNE